MAVLDVLDLCLKESNEIEKYFDSFILQVVKLHLQFFTLNSCKTLKILFSFLAIPELFSISR